MNTFTIFWLDGKSELVTGVSIRDAFAKAGYGGGAISAVDFYDTGDSRDKYVWDPKLQKWNSV